MGEFFRGSFTDKLKVDQALLNVTSSLEKNIWLYQLSDECVSCPFKKVVKISARKYVERVISTEASLKWSVFTSNIGPYAFGNGTPYCVVGPTHFGQFGVYNLTVDGGGCRIQTTIEPVNTNLSILALLLLILLLYFFMRFASVIFGKYFIIETTNSSSDEINNDMPSMTSRETVITRMSSSRLCSLDAFRGLAIVSMIFANSGCGKYNWFEHASWNGIHAADFIFPSFLWIMGVCIPISQKSAFARNIPKIEMLKGILNRSLKLFIIGLCIHTAHGPDFKDIRIMGVLQRFGIAYLVIASIQVLFQKPLAPANSDNNEEESSWKASFIDITSLALRWLIMIIIIAVHLIIIFCLPVPNCGTGYLGPGGIHEMARYNNCIGGAAGYIDRLLISSSHLYQRPRASHVYDENVPFDPEGPFGSLLTIVQVFFGVQCGYTILLFSRPFDRIKRWIGWGLTTLFIGLCLCKSSVNDGVIPLNKNLWSLSFVFVTTGFAFLLLAIFYLIIDVKKWWTGKPLTFAGMNAILMYIGSELLGQMYPFYWHFSGTNTHFMFLLANLWNAAMWNIVAYYLFLRKIFFSL